MENWHLLHTEPDTFAQNELYHACIDDQHVCFGKNSKGFFACLDKCPHLGVKLSKGTLSFEGDVVCALHQYCYNPHTGKETKHRKTADLKVFQTEIREDGFLYVALPEKPKKKEKKDDFAY